MRIRNLDPRTQTIADPTEYMLILQIEDGVYTSEQRGSDEAGEGTYRVPFKSVMKVSIKLQGFRRVVSCLLYLPRRG